MRNRSRSACKCIVEKKKRKDHALTITNCFFYPTNGLTRGCRFPVLSCQKQDFFLTKIGHPRAPSKIRSFIRSVRLSFTQSISALRVSSVTSYSGKAIFGKSLKRSKRFPKR